MEGTTEPILTILGNPIAGNPSQFAIERALDDMNLEWRVLSFDVREADIPAALDGLEVLGIRGVLVDSSVSRAVANWYAAKHSQQDGAVLAIDCLYRDRDGLLRGSCELGDWFTAAEAAKPIAESTQPNAGSPQATFDASQADPTVDQLADRGDQTSPRAEQGGIRAGQAFAGTGSDRADTDSGLAGTDSGLAGTDSDRADTDSDRAGTDSDRADTDSDRADTDSDRADTDSGRADTDSGLAGTGAIQINAGSISSTQAAAESSFPVAEEAWIWLGDDAAGESPSRAVPRYEQLDLPPDPQRVSRADFIVLAETGELEAEDWPSDDGSTIVIDLTDGHPERDRLEDLGYRFVDESERRSVTLSGCLRRWTGLQPPHDVICDAIEEYLGV
ncbi:MAG: hypothetical protein P8L85_16475 [Rubripirellula sp.]|nr:hypothetical protein [Rubripirellula sp.]